MLAGCDSGPGESIYNPDAPYEPDPVVSGVTPEPGSLVLAGIDAITITGENFSADVEDNLVFFDEVQGEVLSATPTELRVQTPNTPKDALDIRVTVIGAENFSNSVDYTLTAAAERVGELNLVDVPLALAVDDDGFVYTALISDDVDQGVVRIAPDGERTVYAPSLGTSQDLQDLAFGPDQSLYGVIGLGVLFRLPEGGPPDPIGILADINEPLSSIAPDGAGSLWLGSDDGSLFRFDLGTSTFEEFSADAEIEDTQVRDLVVFGGYLYVALTQQEEGSARVGKVVRFPIEGTALGTREDYVDVSDQFAVNPLSIALAADGRMLIGTNGAIDSSGGENALLLVDPSGSADVFYDGILRPPIRDLVWGPGTGVYALGFVAGLNATEERRNARLVDDLLPLPDIIRIETRIEGP